MKWLWMAGISLVAGVAQAASPGSELERGFAAPPDSARPWVNWFWLNGNITSNGLTADLEAMRRVGIGGVMLMDVEQGAPDGPVRFGTEGWRGMFQHMSSEARRLGLEIDMHNADGWCGSGGPWVTPEISMKTVVWSETTVEGGRTVDQVLSRPRTATDHYRELAVFAFPTTAGEEVKMGEFSPRFTGTAGMEASKPEEVVVLPRPESTRPVFVQIEFPRPFTARMLRFGLRLGNGESCQGELQVSADGTHFLPVRPLSVEHLKQWYGFPEVTSRYWRVVFTSAEPSLKQMSLTGLELSPKFRIEDIEAKALFVRRWEGANPVQDTGFVPGLGIPRKQVLDLSDRMGRDGRLRWEAPAGSWTVMRMGYASNGRTNHPAQPEGRGLECDKLSKDGVEVVFNGLMRKLVNDTKGMSPNPLVSVHIDSWEVGAQNWTERFRQEFKQRRGYDPVPWLPVMTGRALESLDASERFLWDLRQTASEMLSENYAGHFRDLARRHGMRLSVEAYGENPSDDMTYAARADEPMAEIWSWYPYTLSATCTEMASVAHVYGKPVVSLEAFTAVGAEKWQGHPYSVKVYGDWAFCEGINKMIIHRYAHQPWTNPDRVPGMGMGPYGIHHERTQTWWEQSRAFHEYLARCQFLLQQGLFVADICYVAAEVAPRMWLAPTRQKERPGYNFDGCPAEAVLTRMSVRAGRIVLPDGMNYRLLVLPETRVMTPRLLRKIRQLVSAGATVVGPPPQRSPSLENFPRADEEVRRLASEVWGPCDGRTVTENRHGKGRVIWGRTAEQVLASENVPPDFSFAFVTGGSTGDSARRAPVRAATGVRYTHRRVGDTEVYFVANKYLEPVEVVCAFRVEGRRPELWWADTGRMERAAAFASTNGTTAVPLRLDPAGSVFVVFREAASERLNPIAGLRRESEPILEATLPGGRAGQQVLVVKSTNTFTMAGWVRPEMQIDLPTESDTGVATFNIIRNDALYPPPGDEVYEDPRHAGTGLSVGVNGVCVLEHSANYFVAPLVCAAPLTNWTYVTVIYQDQTPTLFLNGKRVRTGLRTAYQVHSGVGVAHRRGVAPFRGSLGDFQAWDRALTESEISEMIKSTPIPRVARAVPAAETMAEPDGGVTVRVWVPGKYEAELSGGQRLGFQSGPLPQPLEISGDWQVEFPGPGDARARITMDRLYSWSDHPEDHVKYFSGTAIYTKQIEIPEGVLGKDRRLFLDLGEVQVMAEARWNGRELGILWKPPFRVDITQAARTGGNTLELRVVNLWPNRMVGDEQLPEDSDRKPNGSLNAWPAWLQRGLPSPTGRQTFAMWRLWKQGDPLLPSGLLGPVQILVAKDIRLQH